MKGLIVASETIKIQVPEDQSWYGCATKKCLFSCSRGFFIGQLLNGTFYFSATLELEIWDRLINSWPYMCNVNVLYIISFLLIYTGTSL